MHRKMAFILRLTLIVFIRRGKPNIEKRKIPVMQTMVATSNDSVFRKKKIPKNNRKKTIKYEMVMHKRMLNNTLSSLY